MQELLLPLSKETRQQTDRRRRTPTAAAAYNLQKPKT
jgi:hypothetical protein